ncbi:DUF4393 domain-containing protein [Streptococcus hyovaginalis]|uniref:DUF4393 domain-containing protein n=1 Tax=Streptococcus hyovaginalis TaxID=149015 RepID=UPI001478BFDE|nr:DUF4393 domain-containing protein [Streptococcus hyovaginalis]
MTEVTNNPLLDVTKTVVEKSYEDIGKPAGQEIGKMVERPMKIINTLFQGIDLWLYKRELNFEKTKKQIAENIQGIPEDRVVNPEGYIFIPAVQALAYSMDSGELRNLYANLISKSMVTTTRDRVHPAFVEIIKQFTPKEAILLERLFNNQGERYYLDISFNHRQHGLITSPTITLFDDLLNDNLDIEFYINNLVRLGLIQIEEPVEVEDGVVTKLRSSALYKQVLEDMISFNETGQLNHDKSDKRLSVTEKYKRIKFTETGKRFIEICINDQIEL